MLDRREQPLPTRAESVNFKGAFENVGVEVEDQHLVEGLGGVDGYADHAMAVNAAQLLAKSRLGTGWNGTSWSAALTHGLAIDSASQASDATRQI